MQNTHSPCGLALHTTSPQLGLALGYAGKVRSQTWDLGQDLSTHLHFHLTQFLAPQTWQDLDFIAVAKGPGGFTGTRIGMVTARTLAQQLNIPLFAISTLAVVAYAEKKDEATPLAVQMNARREQLFVAIYESSPNHSPIQETLPDTVMESNAWEKILAQKDLSQRIHAPTSLGTTVESLLEIATQQWQQEKRPHWSEAVPFYGQHPVEN